MTHSRFFRIMAAAVVLALLMLAIPMTSVLAQAIALSVSTGPPETTITITGSSFPNSTTGTAWFDTDGNDAYTSGEPYVNITTDGSGNIPTGITLAVPLVPRGAYEVWAEIGAGSDSAPFTVIPDVLADVATANVGDSLSVDISGFAANVSVSILFDGVDKGAVTTTTSGTYDNFSFTVPACVEGAHTIRAEEDLNPTTQYDTDSVDIDPDVAINPTSGAVGVTITVTGDGFDASDTITITFDGVTMTTTTTNTSGTMTSVTFTVPAASKGSHTVKAQDTGGNYDTATYTVSASVTINPTSGPSGTTVTVTGTGFAASSTINITYDGDAVTTTPSPLTTNASGNFSATFTVPTGDAGTYVVSVSDGSTTITANFESTTSATISETTTEEEPGYVGMSLTITGTGFAPETTITVKYATDPVTIATTESSPTGAFSVTFDIPPSVAGEHTITVSDGDISREFDFWMEGNAPPTPDLVAPAEGEKADKAAVFEWEEVEDAEESDPVTYNLQVATSSTFSTSSIVIDETGLEDAEYTIPEADKLESRGEDEPYYWRVRALDAASNASDWSEEMTFTVGWSFEFSGWVVWVTMVVVAAAFFFFGLWIGRRGGGGADYF